ncbi:MAG: sigma-70 family RNA polymerase sigma factor [Bacteroidia bacterium]|nr:sigma-70 family RNA polymerase sigma factor [Bacteroidia bacterium]
MINRNKIETIYSLHIQKLYNYAIYLGADKELAMDMIHDIFCRLCIDEKKLQHIQNIELYLFRSVKNRMLNTYKSKAISPVNIDEVPVLIDHSADVEDLFISEEEEQEIRTKINEMLGLLTKRQNEIIYLRYVLEYDYAQIAEIMQITPGACRKLVYKAITELRKKYPYHLILIFFLSKLFN